MVNESHFTVFFLRRISKKICSYLLLVISERQFPIIKVNQKGKSELGADNSINHRLTVIGFR